MHLDYLNAQGQPKFVWPASFALARAYVDQLERSKGLVASRLTAVRSALSAAEQRVGIGAEHGAQRAGHREPGDASGSCDGAKVQLLATAVSDLASAH